MKKFIYNNLGILIYASLLLFTILVSILEKINA